MISHGQSFYIDVIKQIKRVKLRGNCSVLPASLARFVISGVVKLISVPINEIKFQLRPTFLVLYLH
jgi:hypothetical protein